MEHVHTATKRLRVILYTKYEKADLHKVMETQCKHLTETQRNALLKLLQKSEELLDGTLGTWKTYPVNFELKRILSQYNRDHIKYRRYTSKCSNIRLKI